MATRSSVLWGQPFFGSVTGAPVLTVSPGTTVLLKGISASTFGGSAAGVTVSLLRSGFFEVALHPALNVPAGDGVYYPLWTVAEPGDELLVTTTGSDVTVAGFGAVLEGVAP